MPLQYERDDKRSRLIVRATGDVTIEDFAQFVADQIQAGLWHFSVLYDATAAGVGLVGLDPPPLDIWRELRTERGVRAPVAFVVADPEQRSIAERYVHGAVTEGLFTAAVFKDIAAAHTWLDDTSAA